MKKRISSYKKIKFIELFILIIIGSFLGVSLFANSKIDSYPFSAEMLLTPSIVAGSEVEMGVLGKIWFPTHDGFYKIKIRLDSITPKEVENFLKESNNFKEYNPTFEKDLISSISKIFAKALLAGGVFSAFLALISFRRVRYLLIAFILSLLFNTLLLLYSYFSFDRDAFIKPKYTGLVSITPKVIGEASDIYNNFSLYRKQMGKLIDNITGLYSLASSDSVKLEGLIKILHISDLHLNPAGLDMVEKINKEFEIDIIVDSGDISDRGSVIENWYYSRIDNFNTPYIFVRGNHDSYNTEKAIVENKNVINLSSGLKTSIFGVEFAGLGDFRFTPDKSLSIANINEISKRSLDTLKPYKGVDFIVIHDPEIGKSLDGLANYILTGHTHKRKISKGYNSYILTEGSSGGGGLRPFDKYNNITNLESSIIYYDKINKKIVAIDQFSLSGYSGSNISINRVYLE
jgi:predicted phosphodiesterase